MNSQGKSEVRIIKTYKPTKSDQRFRQRIKQERGHRCESCGKSDLPAKLAVHHILETRISPEHAKTSDNVLVLCETCHREITWSENNAATASAAFYSALPVAIRQRHHKFLKNTGASSALLASFDSGNSVDWNKKFVDLWTR